ncbi:alpha-galactosidase [Candidatus Symbiothrix dinenymphae]|nr:alpha-galactosidase [Candidatus Symbiothrix dinenymphae]
MKKTAFFIKRKPASIWGQGGLFGLFFLSTTVSAQNIQVGKSGKDWNITTESSVYRIAVSQNGEVQSVYCGNKQYQENPPHFAEQEIPVRGGYVGVPPPTPLLEAVFPDGVRDIELAYKSSEIITVDGSQTLKIVQRDKYYPLEVSSYIRVLPEYDMIEKWVEVANTGKKGVIKVENMLSGSVFLPKDAYELTHYSGFFVNEFTRQTTKLTQGTKTLQVKDFRSYGASTFLVRPEGENDKYTGKVWFGTLSYSGNWRLDFEKFFNGSVQITGGMNFWDQEVNLKPGQSLAAPRMLFGYTEHGDEGVTMSMTGYVREKLLPATHRDKLRPVLYNSWYATGFNVNEEHQLALAKVAKELGVEMFVIDDGWFKGRVNDRAGLGDWTVDRNKFPNGLKSMIDKINAMGLDFGIWIEPEMVNPNSDLYRAHPDWVFHFPNRQRHEGRNQLMLNLAREDVYQYLYKYFHDLLKENNIKFIKWDRNRALSDPGFMSAPADEQRAVRVKYMENLYRLVETLRKDFPEVWFENCSGGGGRIDMAMMSRFDFSWPSDNTDPIERLFIQDSYLTLFPANTMISWVTQEDWHRQSPSLEYKFDVCMAGVLGVGYDITKWDDKQKAIAKEKIALYKEIRETVQKGNTYRIVSPYDENRSILQYVDKDKRSAVVFVYNMAEYHDNTIAERQRSPLVKLRGLLPDVHYQIEGMKESFSGAYLMEVGVVFPLRGAFKSRIFKVKAQTKN